MPIPRTPPDETVDEFNPYQAWLNLDASLTAPDHYQLLGLVRHEENPETIAAAADRAMSAVRSHRPGEHAREWSALLDQLSNVKATLLDPSQRSAYDEQLHDGGGAEVPPRPITDADFSSLVDEQPEAAVGHETTPATPPSDVDAGTDIEMTVESNPTDIDALVNKYPPGMFSSPTTPTQPSSAPPSAGPAPSSTSAPTPAAPISPGAPISPAQSAPDAAPAGPAAFAAPITQSDATPVAPVTQSNPLLAAPTTPYATPAVTPAAVPMHGPTTPTATPHAAPMATPGYGAPAPQPGVGANGAGANPMAPMAAPHTEPMEGAGSAYATPQAAPVTPYSPPEASPYVPTASPYVPGAAPYAQPTADPLGQPSPLATPVATPTAAQPHAVAQPVGYADPAGPQVKGPSPAKAAKQRRRQAWLGPASIGLGAGLVALIFIAVYFGVINGRGGTEVAEGTNPHGGTPAGVAANPNKGGNSGESSPNVPPKGPPTNASPTTPTPNSTPGESPPDHPGTGGAANRNSKSTATNEPPPKTPTNQSPDSSPPPAIPKPAPPPTTPAKPTPEEIAGLKSALLGARDALRTRDFESSDAELKKAKTLAKLPEHKAMVTRLADVADFAKQFDDAFAMALKDLSGGAELTVGSGTIVAVVERRPDSIIIRAAGGNRTIQYDTMPAGLAVAIANRSLDAKDPISKVVRGAYVLLHPSTTDEQLDKARQWWNEAIQAGADVKHLLPLFKDDYEQLQ